MNKIRRIFVLLLLITAGKGLTAQTTITHDIATGSLIISGNSTNNYIVIGSTTTNYVEVQTGYHGVITLRNVNIMTDGYNSTHSPIMIRGQNNCSNLTPVTNVDIVLEGDNVLTHAGVANNGTYSKGCAFQVEQGSQINISELNSLVELNPCNQGWLGGTLTATVTNGENGAGIGAFGRYSTYNEASSTAVVIGGCVSPATTAGGNIVISSGTITAKGGHGAGIGGGFLSYYDGMIIIYGGTVHSSTFYHAAGLGSGCPTAVGVTSCYTPNSAIIVLPPAQITAIGAGGLSNIMPDPNLGVAGVNKLIYIGDTAKPLVTVRTDDFEPYADVYVDLSRNSDIAGIFNAIIPQNRFDITKVKFGKTDANGLFQFHGILQDSTTFFTDATSSQPSTLGKPYYPETVQLSAGGAVVLKRLLMDISIEIFSSIPLSEGYIASQSFANACRIKITYNDPVPMTNIVFDIAGGLAADFDINDIRFYASDSTTQISPPTTLSQGDTIYVVIPLKTGKLANYYTDVFRFTGNWNGTSTEYIRQMVGQWVYYVDTTKNICQGDSVLFSGKYYKETGFYYDTLQTGQSCDSIITLHLVINYSVTDIYDTICQGDSVLFGEKQYNQTGIYTDTLQTLEGCDSIVTLNLTVKKTPNDTNIYDTICKGDSVLFNGQYYTETGIYTDSLQTVFGCDSIAILNLTVNFPIDTIINDTICSTNLPYLLHGFDVSDSGYYSRAIANAVGCDSIIILYLTVMDTIVREIEASICQGETYQENGFNESVEGVFTRIVPNINGCDSVMRLYLTVSPVYHATFYQEICEGESYEFYGQNLTKSGTYTHFFSNEYGCDSLEELILTVISAAITPIAASPCQDTPYHFAGKDLTVSGVYYDTLQNENGCDSIVELTLNMYYLPDFEIVTTGSLCDSRWIKLTAAIDSVRYLWSTGEKSQNIHVSKEGIYSVEVSAGLCKSVKDIDVSCVCKIFLPNAFTPNGDGLNDGFIPTPTAELHSFSMVIYDRWGNRIWKTDTFAAWDGKIDGKDAAAGVYQCIIVYSYKESPTQKCTEQGHITLLR